MNKKLRTARALADIEKNHNHSIYKEIYLRNKKNQEKAALVFRDNIISYGEMFAKVETFYCSLKALGYKKHDEIPVCMIMSPEFIYMFLAVSRIGAKINVIGEWFNCQYLIDILNETGSRYLFITENNYEDLKDAIRQSSVSSIVSFSLSDSLRNGIDTFKELDDNFIEFNKSVDFSDTLEIINQMEFIERGIEWKEGLSKDDVADNSEEVALDDDFTITYTSGTTNPDKPKAVLHSVRSYMTISRFKDKDVSGLGAMKNLICLAHFPTYVHAGLTTSITDPLFENCTIAVEPIYNKEFFIHAILINKPNFVCAGAGFWVHIAKLLTFDDRYKKLKIPYLYLAVLTGEAMSAGEEKFLNDVARKHRFGTAKLPYPLSPITFSIGGGTSESSGVLVTLFKALQEKRLYYFFRKKPVGLTPLGCCRIAALREDGTNCDVDEIGSIVLDGPCTMKGYYKQPELTENNIYTDKNGKQWLKMGVYGSLDKNDLLTIYGRMCDTITLSNGSPFPLYKVEEIISNETKNIMSYMVIQTKKENEMALVLHIEPQPLSSFDKEQVMKEISYRLSCAIPKEVLDILYLRWRDNKESFPVAPSGKRNRKALINEGITCAVRVADIKGGCI